MFHAIRIYRYVFLFGFIISILFPIQDLSLLIFIKRFLTSVLMYNLIMLFSLYVVHLVVTNNRNVCLICDMHPRNFLTSCERCKKIVCTRCYINISIRAIADHRCKYMCPFCRMKQGPCVDLNSLLYLNRMQHTTLIQDLAYYVYAML